MSTPPPRSTSIRPHATSMLCVRSYMCVIIHILSILRTIHLHQLIRISSTYVNGFRMCHISTNLTANIFVSPIRNAVGNWSISSCAAGTKVATNRTRTPYHRSKTRRNNANECAKLLAAFLMHLKPYQQINSCFR